MAYVGNQPAEKYTSLARQTFSSPTGTSFTLDHSVTNSDDLLLYINNVKQDPADYTASGTSLTTPTLVSGDEMYALFYGRATETVNPPDNSVGNSAMADDAVGLAELSATGTASSSTFLRGDNSWATPTLGSEVGPAVSWDVSTTGTIALTGAGFTPSSAIITVVKSAITSSDKAFSLGYIDPSGEQWSFDSFGHWTADTFQGQTSYVSAIVTGASAIGYLAFTSFDSDGITLTRSKYNSPTGTWLIIPTYFR